jgi:hypothetical protein
MVWLVLQSAYMPQLFRLHPEPKWLALDRHERHVWNILKRCESRDEANRVLDEVRAAAEKAKKGEQTSQRLAVAPKSFHHQNDQASHTPTRW